jgi:hypothetical protein
MEAGRCGDAVRFGVGRVVAQKPVMTNTQSAERTFTAKAVLVVDTCVVQPLTGSRYFEIHLAPDNEPGAHRTVLVTRDEPAYQLALALEGKAARVNASWHTRRQGSRRVAVLNTLETPA